MPLSRTNSFVLSKIFNVFVFVYVGVCVWCFGVVKLVYVDCGSVSMCFCVLCVLFVL